MGFYLLAGSDRQHSCKLCTNILEFWLITRWLTVMQPCVRPPTHPPTYPSPIYPSTHAFIHSANQDNPAEFSALVKHLTMWRAGQHGPCPHGLPVQSASGSHGDVPVARVRSSLCRALVTHSGMQHISYSRVEV